MRPDSLPMAQIAGAVFVCRAAGSSTDAVNVLVAFGGVLRKVDPSAKHSTDVSMSFVKAFVDDGIYKRRSYKTKKTDLSPSTLIKMPYVFDRISQYGDILLHWMGLQCHTMEEHALIVMVVVLISDLLLSVGISLSQLLVNHLLDLQTEQ